MMAHTTFHNRYNNIRGLRMRCMKSRVIFLRSDSRERPSQAYLLHSVSIEYGVRDETRSGRIIHIEIGDTFVDHTLRERSTHVLHSAAQPALKCVEIVYSKATHEQEDVLGELSFQTSSFTQGCLQSGHICVNLEPHCHRCSEILHLSSRWRGRWRWRGKWRARLKCSHHGMSRAWCVLEVS